MTQELYIDGKKVDLGNSKITLKYISNLFGDITKIAANRSYTIQLPRTDVNEEIFGYTSMIGAYAPIKNRTCTYIKNGLTIVNNATAILMRVTNNDYEIAITWGINSILKNIIDNNYLLRDVKDGGEYSYGGFDPAIDNFEELKARGYGTLPSAPTLAFNVRDNSPQFLPIVSFRWLYEKISKTWGINFIYSQRTKNLLSDAFLNITDRDRYNDENDKNMKGSTTTNWNQNTLITSSLYYQLKLKEYNFLRKTNVHNNQNKFIEAFECLDDLEITLSASCTLLNYPNFEINLYGGDVDKFGQENFNFLTSAKSKLLSGELYSATIPSFTYKFKKGQCFTIWSTAYQGSTGESITNITFHSIKVAKGKIKSGMLLEIVPNLPKCSVLNFIKDSLMLFNLYPLYKNSNTIEFVSLQELKYKIPSDTVDYSDKLITSSRSLKFDFTIFGQETTIAFKDNNFSQPSEDDRVGSFKIENILAPKKQDITLSEFTIAGIENVKKYDEKDGEVIDLDLPTFLARNVPMQNYINLYYPLITEYLKNPKIIEVEVRLSLFEVQNINYSTPIYFRQFGAYFVIINITAQGNNYKFELLKL